MMPDARSDSMKAAVLPTSSVVTLRRRQDWLAAIDSSLPKPEMPAAARVLIGPAEMAFTRMPSLPRLAAMKRTEASRLALARPITL
ncbi:hypothetical protein D3C72_2360080 [compost metagenome]